MKTVKMLNSYACLGGNRAKWDEVAEQAAVKIEVTAVELDPEAARLYQERFPNDKVIVADAHQYLLEHFKEFDFIWSSPPCPSHSRAAFGCRKSEKSNHKPVYQDMMLYQEILFLKHYFNGKWVVENVIPFYEPLIPAQKRGRHLYWANFILPKELNERQVLIGSGNDEVRKLCGFHEYDFYRYKGEQRIDKMARNLVDYEAGRTILETALGVIRKSNTKQHELNF